MEKRELNLDPTHLSHWRDLLNEDEPPDYQDETEVDRYTEEGKQMITELKEYIEDKDYDEAKASLEVFVKRGFDIKDFKIDKFNETILHHATKYDSGELVSEILDKFPELVSESKTGSDYKGQTALHIAITRANYVAFDLILRTAKQCDENDRKFAEKQEAEEENNVEKTQKQTDDGSKLNTLLQTAAVGKKFSGTVMMGETPLFVAALKFDFRMVDKLLEYGADICKRNQNGDTIFHSLIKYLSRKREKEENVKRMMEHLNKYLQEKTRKEKEKRENEEIRKLEDDDNPDEHAITEGLKQLPNYVHLWLIKDQDGLSPLKLAAKFQLVHVFEYILELKDVYCFQNEDEGLFDVKKYDVTEIDSIANYKTETGDLRTEDLENSGSAKAETCCSINYPQNESVLEMVFDKNYTRKFSSAIIELTPVKKLVQKKWKQIMPIYTLWMCIQMGLMVCLSVYAVERSYWHEAEVESNNDIANYFQHNNSLQMYLVSFQWIAFVIAICYVIIVILCAVSKINRPNVFRYYKHNLEFILLMLVFSLAVIIDVLMTVAIGRHEGIPLIIALFSGWWFNVFFLRGWQLFSFFTVMIKDVIFGDFLRFSVIIAFQLFAFTTCMHTVFQGEGVPTIDGSEENHFGTTLITMFNLMLGLGEIEYLFESRVPWLALTLFILFVLLTYVLLLNALIAMMSSTCESVLDEKYSVWRIQQLSIILFIEDLILVCCLYRFIASPAKIRTTTIYDPVTDQTTPDKPQFLLDMKSRKKTFTEEETDVMRKRTQEELKKTVNQKLKQNMEDSIAGQKKGDDTHSLLQNDFLTRTDIEGPRLKNYTRSFEEELPKAPEDHSNKARVRKWIEANSKKT